MEEESFSGKKGRYGVGLPSTVIDKLQHVQNAAARLTVGAKKHVHITSILKRLHWLPNRARIDFKILLLTYNSLNGEAPEYINELLTKYKPLRNLRTSTQNLLVVPSSTSKSYGDRAFMVIAPKLWNSIPLYVRNAETLNKFA